MTDVRWGGFYAYATFRRFCIGGGPSLFGQVAAVFGIVDELTRSELNVTAAEDSWLIDVIELGILSSGGISWGRTESGNPIIEFAAGAGLGAGFGYYRCFNRDVVPCNSSDILCPL